MSYALYWNPGYVEKKVLIIYYSFSSQTRNILNNIADGLVESGVEVTWQLVAPLERRRFPIGSYIGTIKAMISTYLRTRVPVGNIAPEYRKEWDLVILGGPTWSFQPSGPILALLDRERKRFFKDQTVLPVISCRSYWKWHYGSLKRMLQKSSRSVEKPIVFMHTITEPWCTIGLFLKLAGKIPEAGKSWISKYYPKYGHTRGQLSSAKTLGRRIGLQLLEEKEIQKLDYPVPVPVK